MYAQRAMVMMGMLSPIARSVRITRRFSARLVETELVLAIL